jgi:2-keto-3-deoxy-L-rhamnonate aldolase RhmA
MTPNHLKAKLRAGRPAIGSLISLPDPIAAEAMAAAGFDWLLVDMEHSPIDPRTMVSIFHAMSGYPVAPIASHRENTTDAIKQVLDGGAWGFIAPDVRSAEEAASIVAAAKYPPTGIRSLGVGRFHLAFRTTQPVYFQRANEETAVIIQIEHIDAVGKIDEILAVPNIDACYVGPNDLCASMGIAASLEPKDADFEAALTKVREAAQRRGIAAGLHCATPENVARRAEQGWQLLGVLSDFRFLSAGANAMRAAIHLPEGSSKTTA